MRRDTNRLMRVLCTLGVAYICCLMPARAFAQRDTVSLANPVAQEDGAQLRVYLMTVEAGTEIWEKFGHDALWIVDMNTTQGLSYNYGIFDMTKKGFLPNFLRGRMEYSMNPSGPIPVQLEIDHYTKANRTIFAQELNLTAKQKRELRDFLANNNRPENMYYKYDYFRDNCTTRLRDAIDRVLGGQLKTALKAQPANTTYRWQARRLLSVSEPAYAGIELAMGHPVDGALDRWDDSFLPSELMQHLDSVQIRTPDGRMVPMVLQKGVVYMSTRDPMPATPPNRTVPYTVIGLIVGGLLAGLGWVAARRSSRAAAISFGVLGSVWSLAVGFFGVVIMLLWFATDHTITRANENLLQANILSLVLAVLLIVGLFRRGRPRELTFKVALLIAGLSVLGFVLQILPGLDQFNGEILGLLVPAHLGMAFGLRTLAGSRPSAREDIPA